MKIDEDYKKKLIKNFKRKIFLNILKELILAIILGLLCAAVLLFVTKIFSLNIIYVKYGLLIVGSIVLIIGIYFFYKYCQALENEDDWE